MTTAIARAADRTGHLARLGALLLLLLLAGCRTDPGQAQLCRALIPAFEPRAAEVEVVASEPAPDDPRGVVIHYRLSDAPAAENHWIACRFAGEGLARDRLELAGVATDRQGTLAATDLAMLRIWLTLPEARQGARGAWGPEAPGWLYFIQTLLNALALCCLYALLATGFSLVYGIIEQINLAFGALTMIGGFAVVLGVGLFAGTLAWPLALALPAALLMALAVGAIYGWGSDRLVARHLRAGHSQAVLIATIGLALFLQEFVRLVQGTRDYWLHPIFPQRVALTSQGGAEVFLSGAQVAVLALTVAAFAGLALLLRHTRLGRLLRAVADDRRMAALVGIDVNATIGAAFALGGAFAGLAGLVLSLYYGGLNFFTGTQIGFKALAAAIVGGIGSLAGAALGGLAIGLLETFWSAYLSLAYKDIAIFALLALFLILRPNGLLGRDRSPYN